MVTNISFYTNLLFFYLIVLLYLNFKKGNKGY